MSAMLGCGMRRTTSSPHMRETITWVLVTRDFDFSDIRNYPPSLYQGIVVLKLQEDATAKQVALLLASFAGREDWLKHLTGRLAIVETWRVRFRPA
jgi:hypothetical protein